MNERFLLGEHIDSYFDMKVKEKYVRRYQALCKELYNKDIPYDQAYTECMHLYLFCEAVHAPFTREELDELEKIRTSVIIPRLT